jgi:hypothetical protein
MPPSGKSLQTSTSCFRLPGRGAVAHPAGSASVMRPYMDALGTPAKPRAAWFSPADGGKGMVKNGETIGGWGKNGNSLPRLPAN